MTRLDISSIVGSMTTHAGEPASHINARRLAVERAARENQDRRVFADEYIKHRVRREHPRCWRPEDLHDADGLGA